MIRQCLILLIALSSNHLIAANPRVDPNPDPRRLIGVPVHNEPMVYTDIKMLDPVCVLILSQFGKGESWHNILKNTGLLEQPINHMAKGAWSLHHWCYGNIAYYRATRATSTKMRQFHLDRSAAEYKFMIDMSEFREQNWPYLPDMYAYYGEALLRLNKNTEALTALLTSISMNPKLAKPYISLADYMKRTGHAKKALEYTTEGLRHIPHSKALQNRYKSLGGKQPLPTPYDQSSDPSLNSLSATQPADVTSPSKHSPGITDGQTPPPPSNPYCKFCP